MGTEIHYLDGKWYVYFAAHTSETRDGLFDHRMFVLENVSANPLEGEWVEKGQVVTKWESLPWTQQPLSIEANDIMYGLRKIRAFQAIPICTFL